MRTSIFILLMQIVTLNVQAAILLVNNTTNSPGQYVQIDAAMSAANPGDTIYVNGSPVTYSNCTITKSITLIGAGTFSQKQNQYPSTILYMDINSNLSQIVIEGFKIGNGVRFENETNIHDVWVRYNYFESGSLSFYNLDNSYNFVTSGNVFNSTTITIDFYGGDNLSNFTIENNIIKGSIRGMIITGGTINNNVFYNYATPFTTVVNSALFINNIFYNADPITNTTNCTYINNISYNTSATYATMGINNFDNINPQFINVSATGGYLPTYNFGIQVSSPAHNAGNDGNDLGIYGGSANVTVTGEVYNVPVIRQMILQNTNVPQNGNVNVKVRSTKARNH